jgi:hypothetical protein
VVLSPTPDHYIVLLMSIASVDVVVDVDVDVDVDVSVAHALLVDCRSWSKYGIEVAKRGLSS